MSASVDQETVRNDSWANVFTSIGGALDKSKGWSFQRDAALTAEECAALYNGNALAGVIIDEIVDDAMAGGFEIAVGDDVEMSRTLTTRVFDVLDSRGLLKEWCTAAKWGRAFGGALLVLGVNDSAPMELSLDASAVKELRWAKAKDRRDLRVERFDEDTRSDTYGLPLVWSVTADGLAMMGKAGLTRVHESRCIFFGGQATDDREKKNNGGWDRSVLDRPYTDLALYGSESISIGKLMEELSVNIFGVKDLAKIMANKATRELFVERMEVIGLARSTMKTIPLDAEHESFTRVPQALAGISDVVDRTMMRVSAAARMPITKLFGRSPAGLNATGVSDEKIWNKRVAAWQTDHRLKLEQLIRIVMTSEGIKEPAGWRVKWKPLDSLAPLEQAELEGKVAQKDVLYIDRGVVTPHEVSRSRFKAEGFSMETSVDSSARDSLMVPADAIQTPDATQQAAPAPENAKDPATALNGAQVASMLEIVRAVANREIPRSSAVAIVTAAFPLTSAQAEKILGDVGQTFFAEKPQMPPQIAPGFPDAKQTPADEGNAP